MASPVFPLFLFAPVTWWRLASQHKEVVLDIGENWVKQSHRNRFEIAGPNGKQKLSVPVIKKSRKTLKDVEINYTEPWQKLHWRSIEAAYNRSPYFEFYKDELKALVFTDYKYLTEFSLSTLRWCCQKLQLDVEFTVSRDYVVTKDNQPDHRLTLPEIDHHEYYQVFTEKHGFQPNLSVLDVLFNCGPEALNYI